METLAETTRRNRTESLEEFKEKWKNQNEAKNISEKIALELIEGGAADENVEAYLKASSEAAIDEIKKKLQDKYNALKIMENLNQIGFPPSVTKDACRMVELQLHKYLYA